MNRIAASDFADIVRVSDPVLSPSDERVAFVRSVPRDEREYEATIYTVPLGGDQAKQFTAASSTDSAPRFSPTGDTLAFLSARDDEESDDVWAIPTDGGEARRVTNTAGAVESPTWSPDGRYIAFTQRSTPDEREAGYDLTLDSWDGDGPYEREDPDPRVIDRLVYRSQERYFDDTRTHVYVVDMKSSEVHRITDGDVDFAAPEWGDPTTLYYAAKRGPDPDDSVEYDIVAHDVNADTTETVISTTAWVMDLAATTDGRVAFPYHPADRGTLHSTEIHVHDRSTNRTHELTNELDRTVDPETGFEWDPAGADLYFVTPDEGSVVLRKVDWATESISTVVEAGHVTGFSVGTDAVAVTRSEWDHPGDVFVTTRGGGESNRLTRVNSGLLDDRAVPQPEEVWFESGDTEIQGWLLTPPDAGPDRPAPLVVEVHGGPHAMWSTSGTMWHEFQTLAANGYAVFWSNPRGSTGYGQAHRAAIERDWGAVTMADVMAGIDAVAERPAVNDGSLYLTGGSFGGYMAGWIVGHSDRFQAAVAQRGVYDLIGFYGATDQAFKLIEWDFGATPLTDPAFLWEHSPVAYADQVTTPILLMHSEEDYRVAINDAELFYRLLRKQGVETRLVRYPREGHELSRSGEPGHIVDRLERIIHWFDGHASEGD